MNTNAYQEFQAQRGELTVAIGKTRSQFERLSMNGWVDTLDQVAKRLASDCFKVIVLGEFKRGKSTFINALLGEEVLPAYVTPCTAVINEVKWGEQRKAVLHFRHPLPDPLSENLPREVIQHVSKYGEKPSQPMEIDVHDLERFVVIPDPARDQAASIAESPYEKVELYWPLSLCKNGVEVIDSPGLNEHGIRTKITCDYLKEVDGVIFVISSSSPVSLTEMDVIKNHVRGAGHEYIFFAFNRFDEIRSEKDRQRLKDFAYTKLAPLTKLGKEGVFFVSALDAVDGTERGDEKMVERSNMPQLAAALERFLTTTRGRVKLLLPSRQVRDGIQHGLREVIPGQLKMLEEEWGTLKKRYDEMQPRLRDAERKAERIERRIDEQRNDLKSDIQREASFFLRELADQLPDWAEQTETETGLNVLKVWTINEQAETLTNEVVNKLLAQINAAQSKWQQEDVKPLVERKFDAMREDADRDLEGLLEQIDQIRADLSGLQIDVQQVQPSDFNAGSLNRVLSAAGGFILGGPGMAFMGAAHGYAGMLSSLLPSIGAVIVAALLGFTNPVVLFALLFGTGVVHGWLRGGMAVAKLKRRIGEEISNKITKEASSTAEQMGVGVFEQLQPFVDGVREGLKKEIQSIRDQANAVLSDLNAGSAHVKEKKADLARIQSELEHLELTVSNLVFTLAGR